MHNDKTQKYPTIWVWEQKKQDVYDLVSIDGVRVVRNVHDFAAVVTKDSYSVDNGQSRAYIKCEGELLPFENMLHRITSVFQQYNLSGHIHMLLSIKHGFNQRQLTAKYINYRGDQHVDMIFQSKAHPNRLLTKTIWYSDRQTVVTHQQLPVIDQAFKVGLYLSKQESQLDFIVT